MPSSDHIQRESSGVYNEPVPPTPPRYIVRLKLSPRILAIFPHTRREPDSIILTKPTHEPGVTRSGHQANPVPKDGNHERRQYLDSLLPELPSDNHREPPSELPSQPLEPLPIAQTAEPYQIFIPETHDDTMEQQPIIEDYDMNANWDMFPPLSFSPPSSPVPDFPQPSTFQFTPSISTPDHVWMMITDPQGNSNSQYETVLPMQNVRYHGPPPQPEEYDPQRCHVTLFDCGTWAWYLRRVTHRPGDGIRLSGLDDDGRRVYVTGRVVRVGFDNGIEWTEWEAEMGGSYRCAPWEVMAMRWWNGW